MNNLTKIINDDRVAFAEIAQTLFDFLQANPPSIPESDIATSIKLQCEQRIISIDAALKDV